MSAKQRRPLPLLRVHKPPEVRPESLRRRTAPTREDRAGGHRSTRNPLPRRTDDQRPFARANAEAETRCPEFEQRLASISAEITRAEQALERYYEAFEPGAQNTPPTPHRRATRQRPRRDPPHLPASHTPGLRNVRKSGRNQTLRKPSAARRGPSRGSVMSAPLGPPFGSRSEGGPLGWREPVTLRANEVGVKLRRRQFPVSSLSLSSRQPCALG
jgi:hypothetical protein